MGGKIGSGLTVSDLRETSLISSPVRFVPFLHKYATSLAPPLLTLLAFAFAALEPLLGTESTGEKKGEGGGRERERGIAKALLTTVAAFSTASMAGGTVVV